MRNFGKGRRRFGEENFNKTHQQLPGSLENNPEKPKGETDDLSKETAMRIIDTLEEE